MLFKQIFKVDSQDFKNIINIFNFIEVLLKVVKKL